jgi:hypothetical protein
MVKKILCLGFFISIHCFASLSSPKDLLGDRFIPRGDWGTEKNYEKLDVTYEDAKDLISIHHTVTGSGFDKGEGIPADKERSIVESIESAHVSVARFSDIGFHFLIGPSGDVYEGRRLDIQGAHTFKLNGKNVGVALIGCYDEKICESEGYKVNALTEAMVDSTARLAAYVSIVENFVLSASNLVPRSVYEKEKLGFSRFPGSPGQQVVDRFDEILEKALSYRKKFLKSEEL